MIKYIKYCFLIYILVISFGCKSTKGVTGSGVINEGVTAKYLIKENSKQASKFKTLQAKVKIDYTQDNKTQGYSVNLRIEKDKTIWISATLGLARAMITPNKVQFYDKINNQYFDGDYSLLSDLLGVELDYNKVQSMLLGEAIFNLKEDTYIASTHETSYVLQPKEQKVLLELFYLLNPAHFKMDSQQLYQPLTRRFLQIDYKSYQEVKKQILPEYMHIAAVEDNEEVSIDLEFKSVALNEEVRFPFKIPSGYKEIVLKDAE
jgi:hypothetical protein